MTAPRKKTLIARCTCAGCCSVVAIDRWGDEPDALVEFYSATGSGSFRYRLKTAWLVLRGREHYLQCLSLSGEDQQRLGRFLVNTERGY